METELCPHCKYPLTRRWNFCPQCYKSLPSYLDYLLTEHDRLRDVNAKLVKALTAVTESHRQNSLVYMPKCICMGCELLRAVDSVGVTKENTS